MKISLFETKDKVKNVELSGLSALEKSALQNRSYMVGLSLNQLLLLINSVERCTKSTNKRLVIMSILFLVQAALGIWVVFGL
jgi:hypothetical protein